MAWQFFSILVEGNYGAGKTSLIETLSDVTGCISLSPLNTSVFCGQINISDNTAFLLFKQSATDTFDLRQILGHRLGTIVLINNLDTGYIGSTRPIIEGLKEHPYPFIVVANPHGLPATASGNSIDLETLREKLQLDQSVLMIEGDVRQPEMGEKIIAIFLEAIQNRPPENVYPAVPIFNKEDYFSADRTHRILMIVDTKWWGDARRFAYRLSPHQFWLSQSDEQIPVSVIRCDIGEEFSLHIGEREAFGAPRNMPFFSAQTIIALSEGKPEPIPLEEQGLDLNEHVIGCIGIFDSREPLKVAQAAMLVRAAEGYPVVLIDLQHGQPDLYHSYDLGEVKIPRHIPVVSTPKLDQEAAWKAVCLLAEQLQPEDAAAIRSKFCDSAF